ncbi:MAG: hypothetical protein NC318_13910 [Blautia sp.]|nr:hypothetical protein [Lachnoclostridium sp.]MCM1212683.1 hypothetical protein [Blautia sp.]
MEKTRKRIEGIYIMAGVLTLTLFCLCLGALFEQSMRQHDENMQTVTQIAVVNMDTGVERNGEKRNYASGLVQFPDTNFTYTSLEMAREGIMNGSYAAYIIIPEGFSECAASVDRSPEKVSIQYAVNEELREDIYNRIIGDIHDFEVALNANLSYMYISAILMEFHKGQDAASTIMENDKEELELILGINTQDLLSALDIEKAQYPENELEYTDLSEEMRRNSEYLKNISEYQNEGLEKGRKELEKIKESGGKWQETFAEISDALGQIDITKDEEGNTVYQEGEKHIEELVAEFGTTLQEEKRVIMQNIGWVDDGQGGSVSGNEVLYDAIEESVEKRVADYNRELTDAREQVNQRLDHIHIDVSGNLTGVEELQEAVDNLPEFTYDSRGLSANILEDWQMQIAESVRAITVPDTEEWYQVFQEEIVGKVMEEAEKENVVLKEQGGKVEEEILEYETAMEEYDPFAYIEPGQLNQYLMDLNENIYEMQDEINESTMKKEIYVSSLYGAVLENENTWRENLGESYTATGGNIDRMVSGLKQNKENMNETNTELLLEFSSLLPYTRLGKVEYTEVYDFVSHPLETQDLSSEGIKALHYRDYERMVFILSGILIFWLAAGGGYRIYRFMKEEKQRDK